MRTKVLVLLLACVVAMVPLAKAEEPEKVTVSVTAETTVKAVQISGMENVEKTVKDLQASIATAKDKFNAAVNTKPEERVKRLDEVLAAINNAIKECGQDGEMFKQINSAIATSEAKRKEWENAARDPKISARTREKYEKLARNFSKQMSTLYDSRNLLGKTVDDLQTRANDLSEDKKFVIDLIQAEQFAEANIALTEVIGRITSVTNAIDELAGGLGVEKETPTVTQ